MPTDYPTLVPTTVAAEVIQSVADDLSGVMQLAKTVRMPSGVETMPVVSSAPASGFVDPAYGGLKPQGLLEWEPAVLTAAELATIIGIPNAFIADTSFPVWASLPGRDRQELRRDLRPGEPVRDERSGRLARRRIDRRRAGDRGDRHRAAGLPRPGSE